MKKNVKNIAYIQDSNLMTESQILKYMGNIKYLTSEDPTEIYNFIVCCNKCYKITNFCININSRNLQTLNNLIKNNRNLDKCIFVATRSNADSVRDVIAKNIYFSLSSLKNILNNYKNIQDFKVMTIVSDIISPFYNEIYFQGPKPSYRISELTVEKVNEFILSNGIELLISLDDAITSTEFLQLNKILLDPNCKYQNFATFIELELNNIENVNKLRTKLASIYTTASNVSICGSVNSYPGINPYTLYINCAIQMVNNFTSWRNFIKSSILFNRFTNEINNLKIKSNTLSVQTSTDVGVVVGQPPTKP